MTEDLRIVPKELEEMMGNITEVRVLLDKVREFLKRNMLHISFERLKHYALAPAYIGLFEQHDWITSPEHESVEQILREMKENLESEIEE